MGAKHLVLAVNSSRLPQAAWRPFHSWKVWHNSSRQLGRIDAVKQATLAVQRNWRSFSAVKAWRSSSRQLSRIDAVKKATLTIQRNWRSFTVYPTYWVVWKAVVHIRAMQYMDLLSEVEVDKVKKKLAVKIMLGKMRATIVNLRRRIRIQKHIRGVSHSCKAFAFVCHSLLGVLCGGPGKCSARLQQIKGAGQGPAHGVLQGRSSMGHDLPR